MKNYPVKLALLALFALAALQAISQQPQSQPPASDQQQQPQAEHPAEPAPHVDAEPNPEDRALEGTIMDQLKQDPHMAYSRVSIHVDDKEIVLSGVVLTSTAKAQAAKVATEHAGGRKVH